MDYIEVKNILSKVEHGEEWFGADYNINLYRGCSHGCIYCDSRSRCYQIDHFDTIKRKKNAIEILHKELAAKKKKGVISMGSMSDPYNPLEKECQYTKQSLELIHLYGFGVSITTKSDLILRDMDLLKKINQKNDVIVQITITTADDELCKKIEPGVCVSSKRFEVIKTLGQEGIFTGILLSPVLPFITDTEENIKKIVQLAHQNGAKFIYTYMGMTLRDDQRDYYYKKLDELFPHMRSQYEKNYRNYYLCISLNRRRLYHVFQKECEKYGILYKMEDIIKAYRTKIEKKEQMSFF